MAWRLWQVSSLFVSQPSFSLLCVTASCEPRVACCGFSHPAESWISKPRRWRAGCLYPLLSGSISLLSSSRIGATLLGRGRAVVVVSVGGGGCVIVFPANVCKSGSAGARAPSPSADWCSVTWEMTTARQSRTASAEEEEEEEKQSEEQTRDPVALCPRWLVLCLCRWLDLPPFRPEIEPQGRGRGWKSRYCCGVHC